MSGITDDEFVRWAIWEHVPESRAIITRLENEEIEIFGVEQSNLGMYTLVSDAFMFPILLPVLTSGESDSIVRCSRVVESLLASGRPQVNELTSIRITDHLLGFPEFWGKFSEYAGPLMLLEVENRREFYQ